MLLSIFELNKGKNTKGRGYDGVCHKLIDEKRMPQKCNRHPPIRLTDHWRKKAESPNDGNSVIDSVDFSESHDTVGPVLTPRADVEAEFNWYEDPKEYCRVIHAHNSRHTGCEANNTEGIAAVIHYHT